MDSSKVGRNIAEQRKKLNMTQVQLAEILNVSNKTVSRWENGVNMPDISLLIPLSETLQISLNDLLDGETGEGVREDLLKDTIQMSADQVEKQKNTSGKWIMNLAAVVLLFLTLAEWYVEPKASLNLSLLDPPGFYVLLAEMAGYCLLIDLLDMRDRTVKLISYAPLLLNVCILIGDLFSVIRRTASYPGTQMTAMPVLSCIYACAMIAAHYALFSKDGPKAERGNSVRKMIDQENGHLVLFLLAVATIVFVVFMPVIDYTGVSYRTLLDSFVESKPLWIGNYHGNDQYQGVILTYGYVSLLLCPILCLWAKLRNRIVFVLTDLCLVHILASIINYPIRFAEPVQSWLNLKYVIAFLLPVVALFLLNALYFRRMFLTRGKERLGKRELVIQLIYLVVTTVFFSYLFMAVPFGTHLPHNLGEWYLMMIMAVMAIATVLQMVIARKKNQF